MPRSIRVDGDERSAAVAAQLRIAIAHACRRLRQEGQSGLSPSLTSALAALYEHGPLTPSELAAHERLARPGITRVVARLEREGLVRRESVADGRSYRVAVTPAGSALLTTVRGRSDAYLARTLEGLAGHELQSVVALTALLERLVAPER